MNGLKLTPKKTYLISWAIHHAKIPSRIWISIPSGTQITAQIGDEVKAGEVIGKPQSSEDLYFHAPISGQVTTLGVFPHPIRGDVPAVEIRSDGKDILAPLVGSERSGWQQLAGEDLLPLFQECGLVTLDKFAKPLHAKVARRRCVEEDTLILNACESEPYVTSVQSLIMSHPLEVLKGAELLRKAYGAGKIMIAVEENKEETIELLKSKIYFLKWTQVDIQPVRSFYPPDQEIVPGERNAMEHAATAFAVYEAIVKQKPLIERAVTVAGECVPEAKNLWIRFGTVLEDALKNCKGLLRDPRKVILGGPMRGLALPSLNFSTGPLMDAILALPPEVAEETVIEPCIRCGRCIEVCPVDIAPVMITLAAEQDDFEAADFYGAQSCTECGNCAYVCPAKRPMVELIQYAKGADTQTPFEKSKWISKEEFSLVPSI
ncbi:MAG: 4Fe-4S dicluster domain-containing protein [Candidatus Omnitrophica bacterium]|nr:4Fe-4S dicluster domain-containing protein [Candidatus Omnitrophota bacterium]